VCILYASLKTGGDNGDSGDTIDLKGIFRFNKRWQERRQAVTAVTNLATALSPFRLYGNQRLFSGSGLAVHPVRLWRLLIVFSIMELRDACGSQVMHTAAEVSSPPSECLARSGRGRGGAFSEGVKEWVLEEVLAGRQPWLSREPWAPSRTTVFRWRQEDAAFAEAYQFACQVCADELAAEILEIADGVNKQNREQVRIQIAARKWLYTRFERSCLRTPRTQPWRPPVHRPWRSRKGRCLQPTANNIWR
jgi:hypothetical protein